MPDPDGLADHLLDNYGHCAEPRCLCLKPGPWLGRACPYWRTLGARTFEELREAQAKLKAGETATAITAGTSRDGGPRS